MIVIVFRKNKTQIIDFQYVMLKILNAEIKRYLVSGHFQLVFV